MQEHSDYHARFSGIQRLYGVSGLQALQQAHVCVVGIGGVGSWAAEALARSGVGRLTLIDLDDICISNVNRQIHAETETLGQMKVDVMRDRLLRINPDCQVQAICDFVTPKNVAELITADFSAVIDAIDSVPAKSAIIAHCKKRVKVPIIVTGGAGAQTDPTQIEVTDLTRTWNDPLLAKTRNTLRRQHGFSKSPKRHYSVPCVYSKEQLKYPSEGGGISQAKPDNMSGQGMNCATGFGAATMVTATFGLVAASKAIEKVIAKAAKAS